MRVTTLKGSGAGLQRLLDYYGGLADDQPRRDGISRGPIDYYLDPTEPPGRWWGRGCDALGVVSEVRPSELEALLLASHPATGERLGRGFGDKSARAFDATFSAPKSVSLLWALSGDAFVRAEVVAAHDAAVEAALGWFERHGAVTRRGRDGVRQVDTKGLAVALFRQHTSRSTDPQLHTHAIVTAKVQDPSGRWLSLDARFLKRQQRSIGWVYASALRSELTERLGAAWGPVSEGHADVAGVPGSLIEAFSTRSGQVDARLAELLAAWVDDHDGAEPDARTLYHLERRAALDSRPGKDPVGDPETLRAQWRHQAAEVGVEELDVPAISRRRPGTTTIDREVMITEALDRVAADAATWLHADLAREIATLVPAGAAASGPALVELIDDLVTSAAERCVELHPPAPPAAPRRRDGRPVASTSSTASSPLRRFWTWRPDCCAGRDQPSA